MSEPTILFETDARGVATVTLNRPDVFNAYNADLIANLTETLARCEADDAVRVVVLKGAGKHFSAGGDVRWFRELAAGTDADRAAAAAATTGAMRRLASLAKPTLALVQNRCMGGGVGYVAAVDIAVASVEAKFAVTEVRLGITPAPILPQIVAAIGVRQSRRYALSAELFDAAEALRIGLIHAICPEGGLDDAAAPIIDALLLGAPGAIAETKRMIAGIGGTAIDDELARRLADTASAGRASREGREGFDAFLEKRKPDWYPE